MINANDWISCTGCSSCLNICPVDAINMRPNEEGFLYPEIDNSICIKCDKCSDVCQIYKNTNINFTSPLIFAAINKDKDKLMQSSSGGAFAALADIIANSDGVIIGSSFDESLTVVHCAAEAKDGYIQFQGSKYVQSRIGTVYRLVEYYLNQGRMLLFTGTPCQVDGLKLFLKREYNNLLTADLICHGVPSPGFWKKHIAWLEKKNRKAIVSYRFRGKHRIGWSLYYYYYYCKGVSHPKHGYASLDSFYTAFLNGENYRECCYRCKYATLHRVGDFTIGDYWGAEKYHNDINTKEGVSLIFCNSEKAKKMLPQLSELLRLTPTCKEWVVKDNHNLVEPIKRPESRGSFYKVVFDDIEKWERDFYCSPQWILLKVKCILPPKLKVLLKKIVRYSQ